MQGSLFWEEIRCSKPELLWKFRLKFYQADREKDFPGFVSRQKFHLWICEKFGIKILKNLQKCVSNLKKLTDGFCSRCFIFNYHFFSALAWLFLYIQVDRPASQTKPFWSYSVLIKTVGCQAAHRKVIRLCLQTDNWTYIVSRRFMK